MHTEWGMLSAYAFRRKKEYKVIMIIEIVNDDHIGLIVSSSMHTYCLKDLGTYGVDNSQEQIANTKHRTSVKFKYHLAAGFYSSSSASSSHFTNGSRAFTKVCLQKIMKHYFKSRGFLEKQEKFRKKNLHLRKQESKNHMARHSFDNYKFHY